MKFCVLLLQSFCKTLSMMHPDGHLIILLRTFFTETKLLSMYTCHIGCDIPYILHTMNVKLPIIYSIYVITMMLTIHWCCYFPYPLWWTVYDGWSMSSLIFTWLWLCVFSFFSCLCSFFFSLCFSCFIILLDMFDFWAILFFSLSLCLTHRFTFLILIEHRHNLFCIFSRYLFRIIIWCTSRNVVSIYPLHSCT